MGHYKYYIFNFQLAATLFDLHISFVYSPLPLLPVPAICSTSLFFLNSTWHFEHANFILLHFTLSYCGWSIFYGLVYRYCALNGNLDFFHSTKGVICLVTYTTVYPVPSLVALFMAQLSREDFMKYIGEVHPNEYDLIDAHCCHGLSSPKGMMVYIWIAGAQIFFACLCNMVVMFKINGLLKHQKNHFTDRTFMLHRQLVHGLWVQAILPSMFLVMPTLGGFAIFLIEIRDMKGMNLKPILEGDTIHSSLVACIAVFNILCLHSAILGLSSILMTTPYRQGVYHLVANAFTNIFKKIGVTTRWFSSHPTIMIAHRSRSYH
uniref:G protein-coupled receptor n=1 Tax=Panagrellus redivivus TaxID=6233 RepID=A0A7E4VKW2_PANRE